MVQITLSTPMARLSDLSQELIDLVIDNLKHDLHSLLSCSLLGRAWLSRSYHHLFEKLSLEGDGKTIRRFVSSARRIAPVVKELKLASHNLSAIDSSTFAGLLKALPALRSVVLSEVRIRRFNDEKHFWDIASLDYMELAYKDITPRALVRLLASFAHTKIRVVVLDCISKSSRVPEQYDLSAYVALQGQWQISDLRIMHDVASGSFWELLCTMVDPVALRSLTLAAGVGENEGDKVTAFTKKLGPGLKTLQLQLTAVWTPPQLYEPILSGCTALRSLSVLLLCKRRFFESEHEGEDGVVTSYRHKFTLSTFMNYVLPHIPRTVSHLAISFPRESAFRFGQQTLPERLVETEPQVLARAEQDLLRVDALKRVDVVVGSGAHDGVRGHLRERMEEVFPVLHATGKLRFPGWGEAEVVWLVRPDALDSELGI